MPFLSVLFWAFFAAYVVHILDETLINGGFVRWIADNFWPTYHVRMFFLFNAAFLAAIAANNILFDTFGGHWVIIPIVFIAGFATHALTLHLYWTIRRNTYSPGLVTSSLYLMVFYLLVKYGLGGNLVTGTDFTAGTIIGVVTLGAFLTVGPTVLFPRLMRHHH
jgi:Protein of unknown function with HXXEE motif